MMRRTIALFVAAVLVASPVLAGTGNTGGGGGTGASSGGGHAGGGGGAGGHSGGGSAAHSGGGGVAHGGHSGNTGRVTTFSAAHAHGAMHAVAARSANNGHHHHHHHHGNSSAALIHVQPPFLGCSPMALGHVQGTRYRDGCGAPTKLAVDEMFAASAH